jgi:hypothetical protein
MIQVLRVCRLTFPACEGRSLCFASPLLEGERIKVRGFAASRSTTNRTLTLPSPLRRET